MVVAESKRVLMTGSSLESVGTGTTVLRAEKMRSTKKPRRRRRGSVRLIPTRVKVDSFQGFQNGASSESCPSASATGPVHDAQCGLVLPGEKRRKRRTRSQCVPEAGGSVMALPSLLHGSGGWRAGMAGVGGRPLL